MIGAEGTVSSLACMMVSIDALFDTRLGTIGKFGLEKYRGVIANEYGSRRADYFHGIDPVKYREEYAKRDARTLALSTVSHIVTVVKDFVGRVNAMSATAPIKVIPRIELNTWPYKIPDSVADSMLKALSVLLDGEVKLAHVHYSPKDLHYDLVKFTYDHMVSYDITEWLEAQVEDWEKRNRAHPELTVFFPMLQKAAKVEDIAEDITGMADDLNRLVAPLFNPMQLPIQFFCSAFNATALAMSPGAEAPSDTPVKQP